MLEKNVFFVLFQSQDMIDVPYPTVAATNRSTLVVGAGTLGREQRAAALLATDNTVGKRESKLGSKKLLDVRTANISVGDLSNTDDLDRSETSTVTSSHILVYSTYFLAMNSPIDQNYMYKLTASNDGLAAGHLTVFLVHVVSARARVITEPDTVVLDLLRALLVNL
jgi:hypothetical protein